MNRFDDLTIAIISYNSYATIITCLSELIDADQFKIVIIDNASSDASATKLVNRFPNATVIASHINLGYGRAANLALAQCKTPYFLLVNPDLNASTAAVTQLLLAMRQLDKDVALLAPATSSKTFTQRGLLDVQWVIGAAMLFNLETLKAVGHFDEHIFLFSEESDLCKRIVEQGYKIHLYTDLFMEHLYKQSSAPNQQTEALKQWHHGWSRMYYRNKHGLDHGRYNPYKVTVLYLLKHLFALTRSKRLRYKYCFMGCVAFLRGKPAFTASGQPFQPKV